MPEAGARSTVWHRWHRYVLLLTRFSESADGKMLNNGSAGQVVRVSFVP